jgi:hypothetical protein
MELKLTTAHVENELFVSDEAPFHLHDDVSVQSYRYWDKVICTGTKLSVLGQSYRYWDKVIGTGTKLSVLRQSYRYWDKVIGTGTKLSVLGQSYWYWDKVIGTGTKLSVLGQRKSSRNLRSSSSFPKVTASFAVSSFFFFLSYWSLRIRR